MTENDQSAIWTLNQTIRMVSENLEKASEEDQKIFLNNLSSGKLNLHHLDNEARYAVLIAMLDRIDTNTTSKDSLQYSSLARSIFGINIEQQIINKIVNEELFNFICKRESVNVPALVKLIKLAFKLYISRGSQNDLAKLNKEISDEVYINITRNKEFKDPYNVIQFCTGNPHVDYKKVFIYLKEDPYALNLVIQNCPDITKYSNLL